VPLNYNELSNCNNLISSKIYAIKYIFPNITLYPTMPMIEILEYFRNIVFQIR